MKKTHNSYSPESQDAKRAKENNSVEILNGSSVKGCFDTSGYVVLKYPENLRSGVENAVGKWIEFSQLPKSDKKLFGYNNDCGVGFELKEVEGKTLDLKENFHYTEKGEKWLLEEAKKVQNKTGLSRIIPFIESSASLVSVMKPVVVGFAEMIEKEYGLDGFAKEVAEGQDTWYFRFIHYFGNREVGDVTATAHTDKSGFTLHLYESHAGLQCLSFSGNWENMPVNVGKTVIIPSMQLQLKSEGAMKALCHRVIATPETADMGRISAVCFIPFVHTPRYNKDGVGRLQETEPGFNYKMLHEDFKKYFK